jgi:aminopeptidase N
VVAERVFVSLVCVLLLAAACIPSDAPPIATATVPVATARVTNTPKPAATPTNSPAPSPTPTVAAWISHQQMAMTEAARSDVPDLGHLTRCDIDLWIGVESLTITGRQTTVYTNNEPEPLEEIYFNLFPNSSRFAASMDMQEVTVNGSQQDFEYDHEGTVVRVPFPAPLPPREATTVTLDFTARVPHVRKNYYLVFVMAQGVLSLGDWHPMAAVYDDEGWNLEYPEGTVGEIVYSESAFYTVRVTLPDGLGLEVIATGVEASRTTNSDGSQTLTYYSGPVRDFHIVISDRYSVASRTADDTTINSFYWPEHEECGRQAVVFAQEALRLYNELFGAYPFTELDLAEEDLWPWAIEWPGLILVGEPLYSDPEEECGEWHIVHEVAHQWWYSVVGNDQVDDPWLDEALANYSTVLYYRLLRDPETAEAAIEKHIHQRYETYVRAYGDGIVGGATRDYTTASYYPLVYAKGALFLEALQELMGDEAFFEGLQSYYRDYKYDVAMPKGFLQAMERAHGASLEEFYRHWVQSAEGTGASGMRPGSGTTRHLAASY